MVNTEIRLIIFFAANKGEALYHQEKKKKGKIKRPGADSGSNHDLLIAKCKLELKKIGETPSPFRYDLCQISYDYTVELM